MTYCLGILLPAGLVLASDSRSNAGVDQVALVKKLAIFEVPGIGSLFIKAIETGDETLIMGPVLLYGTLIVTANFLVDLIQLWLNPRLRARAAA